jgi:hypothetical protein
MMLMVRRAIILGWLSPLAFALSGCAMRSAPSFALFGAFFPAWLLCGVLGILAAGAARIAFIASGLSGALPFQLFVCSAIGVIIGLSVWLLWFGR